MCLFPLFVFKKTCYFCFCNQEYQQVSFYFVCCRKFFVLLLLVMFALIFLVIFFKTFKCFRKVLKGVLSIKGKKRFFSSYVGNEENWLKPHLGHFLFLLGFVRLARQSKGQRVIYGNWGRAGRGKKPAMCRSFNCPL